MDTSKQSQPRTIVDADRLVYVLAKEPADDRIDLFQLSKVVWDMRWIVMAGTALFAVTAVIYALAAIEWYRAEVLLAPSEEIPSSGILGEFGPLASLAGISLSGNGQVEAVAVLKSTDFARSFIGDFDLTDTLLAADWSPIPGSWRYGSEPPDIRDAVKFFDESVREVKEDSKTGLVTLQIEWTDAEVAADWANLLTDRVNERMRSRAITEAQSNVNYLTEQLGTTNLVTLQESVGRVLEAELQKLVLARGKEEFAFRVIDRAKPPKERSRPKRTLLVIIATLVGGFLSTLAALGIHAVRSRASAADT